MLRFLLNGYASFMVLKLQMAALHGSSCFDFISLNIKEVVIGMDKCFSMEGMFSHLLVRHLKRI